VITLIEAVKAAKSYLSELDSEEPYRDLRVEEVDTTQGGDWEITLGFYRKRDISLFGANVLTGSATPIAKENRAYKTVLVDGKTGAVKKMKIREVSI
jgi:hypothetical protein